jgi:hypothetical protein
VRVYEAIRRLYNRYRALGKIAEYVRDALKRNKDRWLEQIPCRQKTLLRTASLPRGKCRVAFAAALCNNTDLPLKHFRLKIDFTGTAATGLTACVRCDSVFRRGNVDSAQAIPPNRMRPYTLIGEWPVFYVDFDCVNPADLGYITFELDFTDGNEGDLVTMTVHVEDPNPTGAQDVEETTRLKCLPESDSTCCEVVEINTTTTTTTTTTTAAGPTMGSLVAAYQDSPTGHLILLLASDGGSPTWEIGDQIEVSGNSEAGYNTVHTIEHIYHSLAVRVSTLWTVTSYGGTWTKL